QEEYVALPLSEDAEGARLRALTWLRASARQARVPRFAFRRGGHFRSTLAHGGLADERPPFHAAVVLGRRERVPALELAERGAAAEAECLGDSDLERVEPDPGSDASGGP